MSSEVGKRSKNGTTKNASSNKKMDGADNVQFEEQELASKMLFIHSKRVYIDVKENSGGRFIKVAEVSSSGRKNRILLAIHVAKKLEKCLQEFQTFSETLKPPNSEKLPDGGLWKSRLFRERNRRYFVDLRENERGRFLRISQTTIDSEGPRSQIAIPVSGLAGLHAALSDLLKEYGNADDGDISPSRLPESLKFRSQGGKMFYFDVGYNDRGVFLRVSEVSREFRNIITMPESCWPRVRDYFQKICYQIEGGGGHGDGGHVMTGGGDEPSSPSSSPSVKKDDDEEEEEEDQQQQQQNGGGDEEGAVSSSDDAEINTTTSITSPTSDGGGGGRGGIDSCHLMMKQEPKN